MRTAAWVFTVVLGLGAAFGQTARRQVSVWLIPAENAGPNDIAQGERIPAELEALRQSLEKTGVHLLNVEDPLAMKARSWNPQFSVPNFQVVATQRKTLKALQHFAETHNVEVIVRLVTWDEAFGLLSARRTEGPDALPDVAQIGTSWAGYLAGNGQIRSRPDWATRRGNWRDVLNIPAAALPFANDVRLLFYWKRLPSAEPGSRPLQLNGASWQAIIDSLRNETSPGDTLVFPAGLTLNLLHDYFPLVWAGTGRGLLSSGILGTSIDLTGKDALTVPNYLAGQTHLPLGNGEFRRIVSFPESGHQEVSRTFVNGGYRATLEPANFIGRWAQDFEERQKNAERKGQKRQRFWDYAAAIVPPANFKGGSELVVSKKAQYPEIAFSLADFLATDPDYTQVLAEAGHLPSGRPGYGIKELVGSLEQEGGDASGRVFSEAVQKAIDQGIKYPDLEQWPIIIENREVLELLQRAWRRMGEGDVSGLKQAVGDVEWAINSRLYGPARFWDAVLRSWALLLLIAAIVGGYAAWVYFQRVKSFRRLITLLHLYRASRHESGKILGPNIMGLHELARTGKLNHEELCAKLAALGDHYVTALAPYISQLGAELVSEIQGGSVPANLHDIVMRALNGAKLHFQAWKLMEVPQMTIAATDLAGWQIRRYPSMATVVLQEWFFNCLKEAYVLRKNGAVISVTVDSGALNIVSPGHLNGEDVATLIGRPSKGELKDDAHGLIIIRDIVHCAFGSRVRIEQRDGAIHFSVRLPIVRNDEDA